MVMTSLGSGLVRRFALCVVALALSTASVGAQTTPVSAPAPTLEEALSAEIARFVEADRAAPPADCQVLVVGSSSIVKWRENLAADMAPMPVINRGFGGSHIEYVTAGSTRSSHPIGLAPSSFTRVRTTLTRENRWTESWPILTNS